MQQAELDFVDVDNQQDLPLFIDPRAFGDRDDNWSVACNESIVSFFEIVLHSIRENRRDDAQILLSHLGEPNETCLGLSQGRPAGRGIGNIQAGVILANLERSRAVQSGLLKDISECELFVEGIGADKISDITTNLIRAHLIRYTQQQCKLHNIPMRRDVPSGWLWDDTRNVWHQIYVELPILEREKIIFVPKASVRWTLQFSQSEYYNNFILNFLQAEHLRRDSPLVEILRKGRRRVTKKRLREEYKFSKDFLAEFSENNPEIFNRYKKALGPSLPPRTSELSEDYDEPALARALIATLRAIPAGDADARKYHHFMKGVLEFIFFPDLIYPEIELEIHEGRKRIDIIYTNSSTEGFFFNRRSDESVSSKIVMIECKNYTRDIANPELDQISGRFSPTRGWLGFILCRSLENRARFIRRCRDTAQDRRGFIIMMEDTDLESMLELIARDSRREIDRFMERRFRELLG